MTELVVDASVSFMFLFPEPLSAMASALFHDVQARGHRLLAPVILPVEVTNVIRRHMRATRLTLQQALALLDNFLSLPFNLETDHDLHRAALRLTQAFSLGGHDAHYVALAQRYGCDFWTGDVRILRAASGRLPFVRFIGDYTPHVPD